MQIIDQPLNGLAVIENKRFPDERGFFEEFFNRARFVDVGVDVFGLGPGVAPHFVQVNHSRSNARVLRGLHSQPGQGKLVGVISGKVWDVAVDVRVGSPTRGQHFGLELSEDNGRMLWIPSGFAHGFYVLGDQPADVMYMVTETYNPKLESGILWNDPTLGVKWPLVGEPVISARDLQAAKFD
jgi:dTDP-4-dehydrorhamnose 3,5-epimerase